MMKIEKLAEKYKMLPVPMQIVNPDNFIAANKGAGKDYIYAHDLPEKTSLLETLPDGIHERGFYEPNDLGFEKNIKQRLAFWQKIKAKLAKDDSRE